MMRSWISLGVVLFFIFVLVEMPALGYEEVTVTSGGMVSGQVILKGDPPPARIYHVVFSPNANFCAQISDGKGNRFLREFQVDAAGGLSSVVVAIVGVTKGKPFDYTPEIRLENCRISPFLTPIRNHHTFSIENKDPIVHDIQGYTIEDPYTFAMFNKPMTPKSRAKKEIRLRKGHYIFRTQCGVHDYMQSWGMAVGNPYFAVTGPDGRYTIPDLLPGTYDVIAWHPHSKVQAAQITVAANQKVELNFEFHSSEVDIPLHDLQTSYRLQTALDMMALDPPVELQTP